MTLSGLAPRHLIGGRVRLPPVPPRAAGGDPRDPPSPRNIIDFSDLRRFARLLDRNLRPGLPLFISEWTIPTGPDAEFNFWVDPPVAAQWIRAALRLSRHWHRIYALGWIHVYDRPPTSSGGLLTANGHPKPSFFAFQHG